MNRFIWFLIVNMLAISAILILFFYYSKAAPNRQQAISGNTASQRDFVRESVLLDSLFNNYKVAVTGNDEAALIESELRLKDQVSKMNDNCNPGSLSDEIACKLIHNYNLRIQMVVASVQIKDQNKNQNHILIKQIAELEKSNEQIRLQNQMVEQAILNLP